MGPYVFREIDYKENQQWNDNNTVTFQRKRIWHFDRPMSVGDLSDKVTNLNPVAVSVAYTLKYRPKIVRDIADRVMKVIGEKLIITKTINELLFEGFNDTMLDIARKMKLTKIPMTRFAWFFERNGSASYDGTFNMFTGTDNILNLGEVKKWNYDSTVSYYPGECGIVKGTNGDLWPPLPDNETVSFFVSDICTSMTAVKGNTTVHEGISGIKYVSDYRTLDNGENVPSRKCYCQDECIPSGALNISLCKWGAPAFISFPHFYLADKSYTENIDGMHPDKEKHELSISLEPRTGVPLRVAAQLQLNLLVEPDSAMSMFKNVKRTFIPMLWFTQEAYLTADYASKIKLIIILESLGSVTCYGIGAIGILIIAISLFIFIRDNFKGEETQGLLTRTDNGEMTSVND
ncbi:protein croquemort isoform X2 [Calliopsis andreniformis]